MLRASGLPRTAQPRTTLRLLPRRSVLPQSTTGDTKARQTTSYTNLTPCEPLTPTTSTSYCIVDHLILRLSGWVDKPARRTALAQPTNQRHLRFSVPCQQYTSTASVGAPAMGVDGWIDEPAWRMAWRTGRLTDEHSKGGRGKPRRKSEYLGTKTANDTQRETTITINRKIS